MSKFHASRISFSFFLFIALVGICSFFKFSIYRRNLRYFFYLLKYSDGDLIKKNCGKVDKQFSVVSSSHSKFALSILNIILNIIKLIDELIRLKRILSKSSVRLSLAENVRRKITSIGRARNFVGRSPICNVCFDLLLE